MMEIEKGMSVKIMWFLIEVKSKGENELIRKWEE